MQNPLSKSPEMMRARKRTVHHPFRTLKQWMGATRFLTRKLAGVSAEMSLNVLAYNLKRVMKIIGAKGLESFIGQACRVVGPQQRSDTDRYGRKPFLMVVGALATVALFWFLKAAPTATSASFFFPLISVAILFGLYASSTYATMSELLPTRIRSTGLPWRTTFQSQHSEEVCR